MIIVRDGDSTFTRKLAAAINSERIGRISFPVGAIKVAVEDVVRRKLNDGYCEFGCGTGSGFGARLINPVNERWLTLGEIDVSVGGCIHDGVGPQNHQCSFDGFWPRQI